MKNEVILEFCVWGFDDLSPDEITLLLNIQPVKVYHKGQKVNPKLGLLAKENGWRMGSGLASDASFQEQMIRFVEIIESKMEIFEILCQKYQCEFACVVRTYCDNGESTPWIHLDAKYNNLIRRLNIEFDVDLYCFQVENSK